jgi:uncharacterized membrane protein YhaH (DUF805 family)
MMISNAIIDAAKKTFTYSGRAERLEHWAFLFFTALCGTTILAVHRVVAPINQVPINWMVLIVGIWLILANVSLMVRRLHDHNFSGFILFFPLFCATLWLFGYDQSDGVGVSYLTIEIAEMMQYIGKWSLSGSSVAIASFFARPGNKKENKFGAPN